MAAKKEPGKGQDKEIVREIEITPLQSGSLTVRILGQTPFIFNAVPFKAQQVLLAPGPRRKNNAELSASLKHNPAEEYRNSVYTDAAHGPSLLAIPTSMFKGAMRTAALEMPGVSKAGIGRLIWVGPKLAPMFGKQVLYMDVVRSADQARTPDIRTRALLENWATEITIHYVIPQLVAKTVVNLLAAAGMVSGVGDYRQEKGAGNHGQFHIVANQEDNEEWERIAAEGGRDAQTHAMADPEYYDNRTEQLMTWFGTEITKRGREKDLLPPEPIVAAVGAKKRGARGNGATVTA